MSKYDWGVRTTAHDKAWVQTGFTQDQAFETARKLNESATLPNVEYVADRVRS